MTLLDTDFQETYPDSPYFSDQVLLPGVASGVNLTLVSGFLPSYVIRLVSDVAKSPEVEPGQIDLTFCIPGQGIQHETDALRLARYLSAFNVQSEVEEFVIQALRLADEGGLTFNFLIADAGSNLTRASLGLLHEPGNLSEYVAFVDEQAGDSNSPVKIARSWSEGSEAQAAERLDDLISAAVNDTWDRIRRVSSDDAAALLREIATKGLLSEEAEVVEVQPLRTKPARVEIADEDDDADDFVDDVDDLNEEFEELASFLDGYSDDAEEMINIYVMGGRIPRSWNFNREVGLRPVEHALPFPDEYAEILSEFEGTCKCGQTYDRRYGCAG
jgi:hypothetical protein